MVAQPLDELGRERDPDLYELLLAELISSAWWDAQTYAIAEAAIGELDLDALQGGLGSEILLATMAHYEYRLGLRRGLAVELARRALAPGNLLASGSTAFYDTVVVLARSGFTFDSSMAPMRIVGDPRYPQYPHVRTTRCGDLLEFPPLVVTGRRITA